MEAGSLLEAAPGPGLKYEAAFSITYGAGLRATSPSSARCWARCSKPLRVWSRLNVDRRVPRDPFPATIPTIRDPLPSVRVTALAYRIVGGGPSIQTVLALPSLDQAEQRGRHCNRQRGP